MPTSALYSFTQDMLVPVRNPDLARQQAVKLKASTTFVKGEILAEITATPGVYAKYNSAGNDGTEMPKCILAYGVVTDAAGLPTLIGGVYPLPDLSVPAYTRGDFDCATIDTAMGDAGTLLLAAMAAANWHLSAGTAAAGIVSIG
jgi:hypothetical protein